MNPQIESFIKSLKNIEVENYKSNTRKKLLQDFETQLSGNSECTESLVYILENRKDWQLKVASLCIICDHLLKTNLDIDLSMRTFTTLYKLTTELKEFNPSLSIGCLMRLLRRQDELKYSKIQEKVDDEIKKAKDAKMKEDDEKAKRSEEELYQLYGYGKENAAKTTNKKGKQANQKSKKKETGQKAKSPMDGERSYSEASTIDPGQGEDADGREREEDDVNVTSNDKQSPAKEGTDNADVRGQKTKKGVNVTKTDTNKKNTPTEEQGNSESGPTNEEFRNTGQNEDEDGQDEETTNQKNTPTEEQGNSESGPTNEEFRNTGQNEDEDGQDEETTNQKNTPTEEQGNSESGPTNEEFRNTGQDEDGQEKPPTREEFNRLKKMFEQQDQNIKRLDQKVTQQGNRIAHLEWISSPLQLRRLVSYLIDPEKSTELDMKNCGGRKMLGCLHVFLSKREIHKDEIAVTDKEMRLRFSSDQFKNNNDPDFPEIAHFPGIIKKVCQHFGVTVDFL